MYVPARYRVSDDDAWSIVDAAGAGHLVVATTVGLRQVLVPFVVVDRERLLTHVSRGNELWRVAADGDEALVTCTVADGYISPRWYPSRLRDPAVVPTWDYVTAEIRGTVVIHDDVDWLRSVTTAMTDHFESSSPTPWRVAESSADYVTTLTKAIVGVEVRVSGITGAVKYNQASPDEDRAEVRRVLADGDARQRALAAVMERFS